MSNDNKSAAGHPYPQQGMAKACRNPVSWPPKTKAPIFPFQLGGNGQPSS